MHIVIKLAETSDWHVIQKLNAEVFESDAVNDSDIDLGYPQSERGKKYYQKLSDGTYGKCFIAYLDDKPVGYVALSEKDFGYRKSRYVEIENIGVSPEFRSQGIGAMLIKKAEEWAREIGIAKLFVEAYWKNKSGINFYQKNGFYKMGVQLEKKLLN